MNIYIYMYMYVYMYIYIHTYGNGKWKPMRFPLISLPFANRTNGSFCRLHVC